MPPDQPRRYIGHPQGRARRLILANEAAVSAPRMGNVGLVGVGAWAVIVLVLHVTRSDLDPVDIYISDYAIGNHGWLMQVAFFAVGMGTLAIAAGLSLSLLPAKRVALSIWLTVIAGVGFIVAGAFTTDPTRETDLTTEGTLHLLGAVVVYLTLVLGSFLLRGVFGRDPHWQPFGSKIRWFPYVLLVGFVVSSGTGEDGPVGLTQRIFATIMMAWLAVLSWELRTSRPLEPTNGGSLVTR